MSYKKLTAFKTKGHKCFLIKNDFQGFEEIKAINILIGKNNSGKSKLLEFLSEFVTKNTANPTINVAAHDKLYIEKILEEDELKHVFRPNH